MTQLINAIWFIVPSMLSVNVNSSIYNHCITLQHVSLHTIMWATVFQIETSSCINMRGSFSNRKDHLSVNLKIKENKLTLESEAYISYSQYFSKPRVMLHVLSGWHNATPCLVLSHLAFFGMAQKTHLHTCLQLLATLTVIGLHNVLEEYRT